MRPKFQRLVNVFTVTHVLIPYYYFCEGGYYIKRVFIFSHLAQVVDAVIFFCIFSVFGEGGLQNFKCI